MTYNTGMELTTLCDGIMDALQAWDEATLPLGLYSASEEWVAGEKLRPRYNEWEGAIVPYLTQQNCAAIYYRQGNRLGYRAAFDAPEIGKTNLVVARFSNIKVRKYGSSYRVDKHEKRTERWEELDLSGQISSLWKQPDYSGQPLQAKILLLIGFDKTQRPLEREMTELNDALRWEQKNVVFATRTWPDKANRGFGVRLSVWARFVGEVSL